jgi:hypothetical protein
LAGIPSSGTSYFGTLSAKYRVLYVLACPLAEACNCERSTFLDIMASLLWNGTFRRDEYEVSSRPK